MSTSGSVTLSEVAEFDHEGEVIDVVMQISEYLWCPSSLHVG